MKLVRDDQTDTRTLGTLRRADNSVVCQTLELPWRDNQHGVSCIPAGSYTATLRFSPKHHRSLYWVDGVPDRDAIELHVGNTTADTDGCILLGHERDGDTIAKSLSTFTAFMTEMDQVESFPLTVTDPV